MANSAPPGRRRARTHLTRQRQDGRIAARRPAVASITAAALLTILVVCSQRIICAAVAALLRQQRDFHVLGAATDVNEAIRLALEKHPHVLLVDLPVLASHGRSLFAGLHSTLPGLRIILLADRADQAQVLDGLRRGAWGVVVKDASPDHLARCIRTAAAGEAWVDRDTVSRLLESLHRDGRESPPAARRLLTPRALEIVTEVAEGATNGDIARKLGLRPQTVKNHLLQIFNRLGVSSRLELALYAVHHELVSSTSTKVPQP